MRVGTGWAILDTADTVGEHLSRMTKPLLIVHGAADKMTDISGSRRLYNEAGSKRKQLIEIPDGNHMLFEEDRPVVQQFLQQTVQWLDSINHS
jgi:alpha-beta hydrolase superfamily lysophospholipase